jgi:ribosomal protein L5
MNRLKEKFVNEISPALVSKFNYKSVMQVPKVEKIVINMGVGDAVSNTKALDVAVEELSLLVRRNQSLVSVFVKECQLERKLLFVENACMNS